VRFSRSAARYGKVHAPNACPPSSHGSFTSPLGCTIETASAGVLLSRPVLKSRQGLGGNMKFRTSMP
jgi:hypothetical protein